ISAGLIETRTGSGTFVARGPGSQRAPDRLVESGEIEELIEWREVLELQSAMLAAERASPEQVEGLKALVERMQVAAADPSAYPEADVEFHIGLTEAAANRFLLQAMADIRSL